MAETRSWKLACKTKHDTNWSYNSLRFKTEQECREYGSNLFRRWTALDKYEVHPSEDAPNYTYEGGTLTLIS
jgi:hypothetical protein